MSNTAKQICGQLIFLLIGVGMYIYADISDFPILSANDIGSGSVPKIVCGLIVALALLKIFTILRSARKTEERSADAEKNWRKGLLVIAVLAAYCFTIKSVGFPVANPVMLFAEMALMAPAEKRNLPLFALIAVVVTAIVFITFYFGLDLMLPVGILREYF